MRIATLHCAIFGLFLVGCGASTPLIQGRIVDHQGMPVAAAVVQTKPPTDMTFTNPGGFFVLQKRLTQTGDAAPIQPGMYEVQVSKDGFAARAVAVDVKSGPSKLADVVMQPRGLDVGTAAPVAIEDPKVVPVGDPAKIGQ